MPPARACALAAAVTSLKMEQPGPYRGTRAAAEAWMAQAGSCILEEGT